MLVQALVWMLMMYALSIVALFGSVLYLIMALREGVKAYGAIHEKRKKLLRPASFLTSVNFAPVAVKKVMALALLAVFLAISFAPALGVAAQTEEPVTIDIPVSQIFSSVNTWIETLIPVYAIPAGIAIAVAILGLIVTLIVVAFGRKGGR